MAVSRPFLLALLAALLAAVAFYASGAGRESSEDSFEPVPVQPAQVDGDAAPESESSQLANASTSKGEREEAAAERARERREAAAERARERHEREARLGAPRPVRRAIATGRTVVIFFFKPGSADDSATARAVAGVRGMRGVSVFEAPIGRLSAYQGVVGALGVGQAPAVVIVGKGRRARLTEGFIDGKTLRQDVSDMR